MAKLTLTDLSSLTNETSAITAINANNTAIENALELTLSRNGTTPNEMSANIDMNGFRVLNLAAPVDDNDAVRLIDVVDGIKGDQGDQGPSGGPISDGDYGDIIATVGGTVLSLDPLLKNQITDATADIAALGDSATKNVGTTAGTVAAGDDSRIYKYNVNTQSGNYAFVLSDALVPTIVFHNNATPHAWTVNPVGTTAYPQGAQITVHNSTVGGAITLTRGVGVAFYLNGGLGNADVVVAAGGLCTMIQIVNNAWLITGTGLS